MAENAQLQVASKEQMARTALIPTSENTKGWLSELGFGNTFSNSSENRMPDLTYQEVARRLIDTFANAGSIPGDLVALGVNVEQINITARDFIYEPKVIESVIAVHAPYKYDSLPLTANFNAGGEVTVGGETRSEIELVGPDGNGYIGWAFRFTAADTLNTECSCTVKSSAGCDIQVELIDIDKNGWFVVLNHRLDQTVTVKPSVPTPGAGSPIVATFETSASNVSQQFTFATNRGTSFTVAGVNANVRAYPIYFEKNVIAVLNGLYYADQLDLLPAVLVAYIGS